MAYELFEYKNDNKIFQRKKNNPFPSQGYYKKVKTFKIKFRFEPFEKLDGLYALISSPSSDLSVEEMIYHYREKSKIEEAFRTMKSLIKLRPWYVYKEEHVFAHYSICVIAYFIEKVIDEKLSDLGLKNVGYTFRVLLDELAETVIGKMKLGKLKKSDLAKPSKAIKSTLTKLGISQLLKPSKLLAKF
ncbi:MAG: transposase [Pseudomonadota bacterium]